MKRRGTLLAAWCAAAATVPLPLLTFLPHPLRSYAVGVFAVGCIPTAIACWRRSAR